MKFLIIIFLLSPHIAFAGRARCPDLLSILVKFMSDSEIVEPVETLREAKRIAKELGVQFTDAFLKLPANKQLEYLNGVNEAYSKIPPLIRTIVGSVGYQFFLAVDSVGNDRRFSDLLRNYPDNSTRGLCVGRTHGRYVIYVVNNNIIEKFKADPYHGAAKVADSSLRESFANNFMDYFDCEKSREALQRGQPELFKVLQKRLGPPLL